MTLTEFMANLPQAFNLAALVYIVVELRYMRRDLDELRDAK